jgi:hypothetical protein
VLTAAAVRQEKKMAWRRVLHSSSWEVAVMHRYSDRMHNWNIVELVVALVAVAVVDLDTGDSYYQEGTWYS